MFNLKLALRTLFRTPFVTAVAILSLALGIGANAAIFSLFNQIILKPLPVPEAGRLVNLANPGPKSGMNSCGDAGPCTAVFSYPMFRDLEKARPRSRASRRTGASEPISLTRDSRRAVTDSRFPAATFKYSA